MPIYINDDSECINFIHIPKTAGTSLDKCLSKDYPNGFFSKKYKIFGVTPQHLDKGKLEKLGFNKLGLRSFCVVREPVERIKSEYRYLLGYKPWYYRLLNFDAFVSFSFMMYKLDANVFDNHIRPQSHYIYTNTIVYKFEDGLDTARDSIKKDFSFVRIAELQHSMKSASRKVYISSKTLSKIHMFYASDYDNLNYDRSLNKADIEYTSKIRVYLSIISFSLLKVIHEHLYVSVKKYFRGLMR